MNNEIPLDVSKLNLTGNSDIGKILKLKCGGNKKTSTDEFIAAKFHGWRVYIKVNYTKDQYFITASFLHFRVDKEVTVK